MSSLECQYVLAVVLAPVCGVAQCTHYRNPGIGKKLCGPRCVHKVAISIYSVMKEWLSWVSMGKTTPIDFHNKDQRSS